MRAYGTLIVAFALGLSPRAQAQNLDSLYTVWQDQRQPDSIRVAAYTDYIWDGYLYSRPDTAAILAEGLHAFAKAHQYPTASAKAYNLQGVANKIQGNYPRALEYYQKSLAIDEGIGYKKGMAASLNNIGSIYEALGNYPLALDYFEKSLAIRKVIGDKIQIANSLSNIGVIYEGQGNYPLALDYFEKSLAIREKNGDKYGISVSLNNIGVVLEGQGNYPLALENHLRSLAIREEMGDKSAISVGLFNIGLLYQRQGKNNLGLSYCQKSLALAEEIGSLDLQMDACRCQYESYKAMGKGYEALRYHEQMIMLRDSIYNEENTKQLTRLEMQYDFDKKEAATLAEQEKKDAVAAQELKRQKLVRNGIGGGLAFALLFLGVVWRQRNRIGKEKKRSEELLLNILPEEVAEELKAKGSAEAVHIDQVTVLFTDFKGFTAMSETLSPQELVRDLNECFSAFDHITAKYGIEKIKTIGDAYMAAGGLPTPNTTHATDVIKAAFEMRDLVAESKARKIAAGLPFFEIRIGVHTGPVVAGIVGVKKFSYDIWGDTVNTASRMESSGEVGQVNISEATYELVKSVPGLTFTPRGKVQAKGKGEMEMYFVDRA
jgi:class 3 adenylate cyclase/Tfp pilus assembly protein PilF